MSAGFGGNPGEGRIGKSAKITIDLDEVHKLSKQYKKIKKYSKSNIFKIKTLDNSETIISSLMKEYNEINMESNFNL